MSTETKYQKEESIKLIENALRSSEKFPINLEWMVLPFGYKHISSLVTHLKRHGRKDKDFLKTSEGENRQFQYFITINCFITICGKARHSNRKEVAKYWLKQCKEAGRDIYRCLGKRLHNESDDDDDEDEEAVYEEKPPARKRKLALIEWGKAKPLALKDASIGWQRAQPLALQDISSGLERPQLLALKDTSSDTAGDDVSSSSTPEETSTPPTPQSGSNSEPSEGELDLPVVVLLPRSVANMAGMSFSNSATPRTPLISESSLFSSLGRLDRRTPAPLVLDRSDYNMWNLSVVNWLNYDIPESPFQQVDRMLNL